MKVFHFKIKWQYWITGNRKIVVKVDEIGFPADMLYERLGGKLIQ